MSLHSALTGADLHVPGYIQASDPGTVGAGKLWYDTTLGEASTVIKQRNAANTGWITLANAAVASVPAYLDAGNSGTALTVTMSAGQTQKITLTGNCTFTFSGAVAGDVRVLHLVQDATGSRTVTWPAAVKWAGATAPTLTTTAAKRDIITLSYDGTNYYAVVSGQNY